MSESRYAIGIDLGTTHCALSFVDIAQSDGEQITGEVLEIAQLTAPGLVENKTLLPSFVYLPHADELTATDLTLPWPSATDSVVGELARRRGALTPIRLVSSAKSWLGHSGVDRHGAILPVDAPPEVARISPLAASVRFMSHLREAWNTAHPDAPLDKQAVTITIPASFDPAARELTAEAVRESGIPQFNLLEEPQAALYSWIQATAGQWRQQTRVRDVILVIDVGGGTTDFSLIFVNEEKGNLELNRIAVGDHILLGGDNMDLALAHVVAAKLAAQGTRLEPWQVRALTQGCCAAKEKLLSDPEAESARVVVPSRSSKLIGGSLGTELTRHEVTATILEGFFPSVEVSARPVTRTRAGLTQIGLPYAQDAAVTRHLGAFLQRQMQTAAEIPGLENALPPGSTFIHPTAVLFNGGVFKSGLLIERILTVLNRWLAAENAPAARCLAGADLDLAVARGAAYYGYVRRGKGVRIRGGTARAYYVGIESTLPAVPGIEPPLSVLCLAPFGMEEGTEATVPTQQFGLVVGEPVRFRFFGSTVRRQDQVGTLLEYWSDEEILELGDITVTLPTSGRQVGIMVPVQLQATVTETGTLLLEALPLDGRERWKVEFDMRGGSAS